MSEQTSDAGRTPEPRALTHEERRRRIAEAAANRKLDKLVFGAVLVTLIAACMLYVDTLNVRNEKSFAGYLVACVTLPTVVMFLLYDRVKRFVLRLLGK